jgi:hypothetical protein
VLLIRFILEFFLLDCFGLLQWQLVRWASSLIDNSEGSLIVSSFNVQVIEWDDHKVLVGFRLIKLIDTLLLLKIELLQFLNGVHGVSVRVSSGELKFKSWVGLLVSFLASLFYLLVRDLWTVLCVLPVLAESLSDCNRQNLPLVGLYLK